MAIQSHFRRGWGYKQLTKLGNPYNLKPNDLDNIKSFNEKIIQHKKKIYLVSNINLIIGLMRNSISLFTS